MNPAVYGAMFHAFPIGLLLLDDKGAILDANAAARDLPTGAGDDLKGQDFFQVFEGLEDHQAIFDRFIIAEDHHQNYYQQNKTQGYCQVVINPKLAKFRKEFADKLKN